MVTKILKNARDVLTFQKVMMAKILKYPGDVLSRSSGLSHIEIYEGPLNRKRKVGSHEEHG